MQLSKRRAFFKKKDQEVVDWNKKSKEVRKQLERNARLRVIGEKLPMLKGLLNPFIKEIDLKYLNPLPKYDPELEKLIGEVQKWEEEGILGTSEDVEKSLSGYGKWATFLPDEEIENLLHTPNPDLKENEFITIDGIKFLPLWQFLSLKLANIRWSNREKKIQDFFEVANFLITKPVQQNTTKTIFLDWTSFEKCEEKIPEGVLPMFEEILFRRNR